MVFDCAAAYIGSANLTGAGMGMKSENGRNFEAGILTDDPTLVDAAADHLEGVWQGRRCIGCRHNHICGDRIDSSN
jgi:phosphatidylserine/phosphatidylglycerophosphate/cardiolipin synthase-like enzyme